MTKKEKMTSKLFTIKIKFDGWFFFLFLLERGFTSIVKKKIESSFFTVSFNKATFKASDDFRPCSNGKFDFQFD